MNAQDAIESLRLKFASGNSVPVTRSQITREEFEAIKAATALQSSGGEVVAGKWRQLTTADEVKAALAAEQAVEWTSTATDSIDMPGNREPDSGGWIPHTKNHYTEDRLFKIGKFRAFITASPAQPSGFVLVPVEPTPAMRDAYNAACKHNDGGEVAWLVGRAYKAMLAAAPAPIEQEG